MSGDTPSLVSTMLVARYAKLTPAERISMAFEMFDSAVQLARAEIVASQPGIDAAGLRRAILMRFYARDLTPTQLAEASARSSR